MVILVLNVCLDVRFRSLYFKMFKLIINVSKILILNIDKMFHFGPNLLNLVISLSSHISSSKDLLRRSEELVVLNSSRSD